MLAVAITAQISARVLDAGVETPAEKLAQTLLPSAVRGRIGGFLDGTAKRAGAAAGGLVAAALAGSPAVFYAVMAIAAALWLVAAARLVRELPALAIEHVVRDADADAEAEEIDARAIASAVEVLHRELAGPRPERAAEVLARLHERGRADAIGPLVAAAAARGGGALWRTLVAALAAGGAGGGAVVHGPALVAAARAARPGERELAVRAIGLAGGASPDEVRALLPLPEAGPVDAALALAAEIAALRLQRDRGEVLARLAEAIRDGGPTGRAAADELCAELGTALAALGPGDAAPGGPGARGAAPASPADEEHALEAARHLARALRRGRGDAPGRAAAFAQLARVVARLRERRSAELSLLRADLLELVRERVETGTRRPAPDHMLTSLVRLPVGAADETPGALRLYGALLEGADAIEPDDLRRIARALGEPDDDVRAAAEEALAALGPAAAGELVATAAWGRRRARPRRRAPRRAARHPRRARSADRRRARRARSDARRDRGPGGARRRAARAPARRAAARDRAHRAAPRGRPPPLARDLSRRRGVGPRAQRAGARAHARGDRGGAAARARGPPGRRRGRAVTRRSRRRARARRDRAARPRRRDPRRARRPRPARPRARAARPRRRRPQRPPPDHRRGRARGGPGRVTRRSLAPPRRLARRAAPTDTDTDEGAADMPSRVETLIALGRVPLLAALTTRQLADVAERARWVHARQGSVVITAGDLVDALIVVEDGELALGERRIVKAEAVDELACVAPQPVPHDLVAVRAARLIRLERPDFEELVDDVPGLAAAICRALGERARRAEDRSYRSPLTSRA